MNSKLPKLWLGLAAVTVSLVATPAWAIPAFARKYGTSCLTCHTVYPKLTPFGEAFRRNGYRFPGVDSDYVKKETVPMGQESYKTIFPNAVWPGTLPIDVPIAIGFNGQAVLHPQTSSSGAQADNGTVFTTHDLVAEAHVWLGGSFDDKTTFWGELTVSPDGAEVEHAQLLFNDIIGPAHAVNVTIGHGFQTLSAFGTHSSYMADTFLPAVPVTAIYGATTDSFNLIDNYNGIELGGTLGGRFQYNVGVNAGVTLDIRPIENVYGHVAYKLGGMRLDGEGSAGPEDAQKPWAETSATLDLFAYHSYSRFSSASGNSFDDWANTVGGALRLQWQSLELSGGAYFEAHNHAQADNPDVLDPDGNTIFPGVLDANGDVQTTKNGVSLIAGYGELSYIVFPWLVPAVRFQYVQLTTPLAPPVNNLQIIPGIAFLIRPNIRLIVQAQLESASGAPYGSGSWAPVSGGVGMPGSMAAPASSTAKVPLELEAVSAFLAAAF